MSQHVRQGTVSPTHYIVVDDGLSLKPDHMQGLTYKMTHLYYNWPGTVRVPAPCQVSQLIFSFLNSITCLLLKNKLTVLDFKIYLFYLIN